MQGLKKKLEFQLALGTSSSRILLVLGNRADASMGA